MSGVPTRFARSLLFVLLLLLVFGRLPAHAVSLSIDSTSTSDYSIFAIQLDDITSLRIQVDYDVSTLKNPKISPTGMLLSRATVHTGITSKGGVGFTVQATGALIGSGMIATLDFDLEHEEWPGKIISAMATVTEENGKSYVVPITVNNPPQQRLKPAKEEEQEQEQEQPVALPPSSAPVVTSAPPPESSPPRTREMSPEQDAREAWSGEAVRGVLERFFALPEGNLPGGLRQLIAGGMGEEFVQEPPLALSDGTTQLRVRFRPAQPVRKTPFFVIRGGACVSLEYREDAWELRLLPRAGARDVGVIVTYDTASRDYPLTVAPPLDLYLASRRKDLPPNRYDNFVRLINEFAGNRGAADAPSLHDRAGQPLLSESGSSSAGTRRVTHSHRRKRVSARSR